MVLLKLKIIRFITVAKNQASSLGIGNLNLTILILTKNKTNYLFKTNKVQNVGLTSKETQQKNKVLIRCILSLANTKELSKKQLAISLTKMKKNLKLFSNPIMYLLLMYLLCSKTRNLISSPNKPKTFLIKKKEKSSELRSFIT